MEKLNLPINELLDKLEQLKARNRDLLTIDEIQSLDEAIFRLQSVRSGNNHMTMEDLIVLIKLLFEFLTDNDFLNNI